MVKFLGLYDAGGLFLDFSLSVHRTVAKSTGRDGRIKRHLETVKNLKMSPKRRTDLKIWPSKAKNLEELDFDVRKSLAPRKSAENNEKPKTNLIFRGWGIARSFSNFTISEFSFSSFLIDFGGARLFLMSKSSSSRFFALDGQIFRSVRRLGLIFRFCTVRTWGKARPSCHR